MHFAANRALSNIRPNIAATDDTEGFAKKLSAYKSGLLPFTRMGGFIGLRNLPRQ